MQISLKNTNFLLIILKKYKYQLLFEKLKELLD